VSRQVSRSSQAPRRPATRARRPRPGHSLRRALKRSWKARLLAAFAILFALFLFLVLIDSLVTLNRIHPGITVSGETVGGLTRPQAEAKIAELVEEAGNSVVVLTKDEYRWPLRADDLGVDIDVEATVADAYNLTRDRNFFVDLGTRISLYFSSRDVELQGVMDDERTERFLDLVSEKLDDPAVNAGLRIEGGDVTVIEGRDGLVVDRELLRCRLEQVFFSFHSTEIPVPMKTESPRIQATDTAAAVAEARTMIGSSATLFLGDNEWPVTTSNIADFMDFTVEGGSRLVPFISAEKAVPLFDRINDAVKLDPKNAGWSTDGKNATIIPSVAGRKLDREKTAEILTEITKSSTGRRGEIAVSEIKPDRTTEDAEAMGIKAALGSYTTEFGGSENRRDNVQLAAQIIHNTLIAPGEQFNFNDVVGRRTSDRGFKTAPVIVEGGRLEDDLGGGICQVSTTLFNAAFFAGVEITERWNHSRYLSSYPAGRDATVSWPAPNLRFRNDTPGWILIRSSASRNSVTFVIYGTSQGRKVTYTTSDFYNIRLATEKREKTDEIFVGETRVKDGGQDGKEIRVVRTVTQDGKVIHKDTFISNYPMFSRVVQEGTKPTTTTTLAPTTTTTKPPSPTTTTTTAPPTTTTTSP